MRLSVTKLNTLLAMDAPIAEKALILSSSRNTWIDNTDPTFARKSAVMPCYTIREYIIAEHDAAIAAVQTVSVALKPKVGCNRPTRLPG